LESLLENARFLRAEIIDSLLLKEEKMKKFWLILLSLGLVMAFSVSAFAVDVKVSGEYYAAGLYLNKTLLGDNITELVPVYTKGKFDPTKSYYTDPLSNPSTAFFFQRLRVGTDFIVAPCLKLVTRFDAMERIWGGARSVPGVEDTMSAGTRAENENIAFDLAYIDYTSPVGLFRVGYQPDYEWGTIFGNRTTGPSAGMITYMAPAGPVTIVAQYVKEIDNSASAVTPSSVNDNDSTSLRLGAIFNFSTSQAKGETGALLLYNRDATDRIFNATTNPHPWVTNAYKIIPYFKATIGPVALQGELEYTFGDAKNLESGIPGATNISLDALSIFLDATANLGQVYVGGSFAYLSGDDPGTTDKLEGGAAANTAGLDWNPCLIMFNNDFRYWAGNVAGYDGSILNSEMSNAWFGQGRVGVKPIVPLDIMMSVSYATADKKPLGYAGGTYGWEVDVTGTYKITNNLSYMLGLGYLFTGDYFKGTNAGQGTGIGLPPTSSLPNDKNDDYMIINKLTLTF
jgi:hypothetical protein